VKGLKNRMPKGFSALFIFFAVFFKNPIRHDAFMTAWDHKGFFIL